MRYDNGKPVDKRKRLFYPYCGRKDGFCLSYDGCHHTVNGNGCKWYRALHPITHAPPESLRLCLQ